MKKILIHLLDAFDNYILRHKFHKLCYWVSESNWWGPGKVIILNNREVFTYCSCFYCRKFQTDPLDDICSGDCDDN